MSTVEKRYLKDENGKIFTPIVSTESVYFPNGETLGNIKTGNKDLILYGNLILTKDMFPTVDLLTQYDLFPYIALGHYLDMEMVQKYKLQDCLVIGHILTWKAYGLTHIKQPETVIGFTYPEMDGTIFNGYYLELQFKATKEEYEAILNNFDTYPDVNRVLTLYFFQKADTEYLEEGIKLGEFTSLLPEDPDYPPELK